MPFKPEFNIIKNKLKDLNKKHNIIPFGQTTPAPAQPHQQPYYPDPLPQSQWQQPPQPPVQGCYTQQGNQDGYNHPAQFAPPVPNNSRPGAPPAVPSHSRPSAHHDQGPTGIYWRANFNPANAVSNEFDQKQGHGQNGWGNNELENYTASPENSFYTPDGKLIIRAISRPNSTSNPEMKYTSARLVSRQTLSRPKGCLTAYLTLPCGDGIWPAFWLLPREPFEWPHEGEIDVAETWNGSLQNHTCLHWGFYTPEDSQKHLVRSTHISDMAHRPVRFDFVWNCEGTGLRADGKSAGGGRLMWYIDGCPVQKNLMPPGTRPIEDWVVLINVAMGGNVCQGRVPSEGAYDLVVQGLQMSTEPEGGWGRFDGDWQQCVDGHIM